ncbi:MAG: MoaD/ThiS family protein [Chloroflexi bacterium]|nr:MoaD/ThiS family protein [Chloroflexota bacterium]
MASPAAPDKGSIRVHLNVNSIVLRMMPASPESPLTLAKGSTLHDLLDRIGLGHRNTRLLLSVNGKAVDRATPLFEGDRVTIMPILGGG